MKYEIFAIKNNSCDEYRTAASKSEATRHAKCMKIIYPLHTITVKKKA